MFHESLRHCSVLQEEGFLAMPVSRGLRATVWSRVSNKPWWAFPKHGITSHLCTWELRQAWGSWSAYESHPCCFFRKGYYCTFFIFYVFQNLQPWEVNTGSPGSRTNNQILSFQIPRSENLEREGRGSIRMGHCQLSARKLHQGIWLLEIPSMVPEYRCSGSNWSHVCNRCPLVDQTCFSLGFSISMAL